MKKKKPTTLERWLNGLPDDLPSVAQIVPIVMALLPPRARRTKKLLIKATNDALKLWKVCDDEIEQLAATKSLVKHKREQRSAQYFHYGAVHYLKEQGLIPAGLANERLTSWTMIERCIFPKTPLQKAQPMLAHKLREHGIKDLGAAWCVDLLKESNFELGVLNYIYSYVLEAERMATLRSAQEKTKAGKSKRTKNLNAVKAGKASGKARAKKL